MFSEFYQIELIVVDIQTLRLDRFGKIYYFAFSEFSLPFFLDYYLIHLFCPSSSLCPLLPSSLSPSHQGQGYSSKGFLIYDGIHYDPLVLFSPNADIIVQRLFPGNDELVTEKALNIARESHKVIYNVILICILRLFKALLQSKVSANK